MNLINFIQQKIITTNKPLKILFPEAHNAKIQAVALQINAISELKNLLIPVLLFEAETAETRTLVQQGIHIIYKTQTAELGNELYELRKHKNLTLAQAKTLITSDLYYATMLLKLQQVNGIVAGIDHATADVLRPALQIIGPKSNIKTVSSTFIMQQADTQVLFSDPSLNVNPTAEQLADITNSTIAFSDLLEFPEKNVALLSFSTNGSGSGESVAKVQEAVSLLQKIPFSDKVIIAGEMQFDAAWDVAIRKKKFPTLHMPNRANIFIFPNLDAANIGYKMVQRMAGYAAIGPVVLGLKHPINDLSRGATEEDIFLTTFITALQSLTEEGEQ